MKLEITVSAIGRYWNGGAGIVIAEPMVKAFDPIKTCDVAWAGVAGGELIADSMEVRARITLRKEAAKEIAEAITAHLIEEMGKNDTHNGY